MTRKMFDSTTAADIPAGSDLVMGYVDGSSKWSDADWQRFPGRTLVRICIYTDRVDANVIDCEPGNNDAQGVVPWIKAKWDRGETPTVYCFSDGGPAGYRISDVRAACDAAGVKRPLVLVSDFDGDPSTFDPSGDPEIIGKQYANDAITGGHYDASVVADRWPGVDKEDGMTPEQEAKLDALLAKADAILARQDEPMVWTARAQRSLDVETGKVFDQKIAPRDPRIAQ